MNNSTKIDQPKILFILNHSPDYRESFLEKLSELYALTVISFPCEADRLNPPKKRGPYIYKEINYISIFGLRIINPFIHSWSNYDLIIASWNPRNPIIIFKYLLFKKKSRHIWWGQIYGRSNSYLIKQLRNISLKNCNHILVYSQEIKNKLEGSIISGKKVTSFNNTSIEEKNIIKLAVNPSPKLRLIFVGRYQERKKLERLITIAELCPFIELRLIGPGIPKNLKIPKHLKSRIELFEKKDGNELLDDMKWAHMAVNPGHLGLFVMLAGQFHRGIIIDSSSNHAPEVILAKKSKQVFVDFNNIDKTTECLKNIHMNYELIQQKADNLQFELKRNFTVEKMVDIHSKVIDSISLHNN